MDVQVTSPCTDSMHEEGEWEWPPASVQLLSHYRVQMPLPHDQHLSDGIHYNVAFFCFQMQQGEVFSESTISSITYTFHPESLPV